MFTALAFFGIAALAWLAKRAQDKEHERRGGLFDDDQVRRSIMFARDDVRLIAYLLAGNLIMLGIIADQIG